MPDLGTLVCYALVGLLFAAAARLCLRDARDRRAGRGDDAFTWRRNSHPNAPTAPKPVLPSLRLRAFEGRAGYYLINPNKGDRILLRREADDLYVAVDVGPHDNVLRRWNR